MIDIKDNLGSLEDNRIPNTKQIEDAFNKTWNAITSDKILFNSNNGTSVILNDTNICNFNVLFNTKKAPYYHICSGFINNDISTCGFYRCKYETTTSTTYTSILKIGNEFELEKNFMGSFDSTSPSDWYWTPNGVKQTLKTNPFSVFYLNKITNLFKAFSQTKIKEITKFPDTSECTSMASMFSDCNSLKSIDLSLFKTTKLTNVYNMFNNCSNLTDVKAANFNTSNISKLSGMFSFCNELTSLGLSGWDLQNVQDTSLMFQGCINLSTLNLSNWDMSNVNDTSNMFNSLTSLTYINACGCNKVTLDKIKNEIINSKLNEESITINVCLNSSIYLKYADGTYRNFIMLNQICDINNGIKAIKIGKRINQENTLDNIDINSYLYSTSGLFLEFDESSMIYKKRSTVEEIYGLPDTRYVDNMCLMFGGCENLKTANLSKLNTSNVTTMKGMFNNCQQLRTIDVSNFDTRKVTDMSNMFEMCTNLKLLNLNGWDLDHEVNLTDFMGASKKEGKYVRTMVVISDCSETTKNKIKQAIGVSSSYYIYEGGIAPDLSGTFSSPSPSDWYWFPNRNYINTTWEDFEKELLPSQSFNKKFFLDVTSLAFAFYGTKIQTINKIPDVSSCEYFTSMFQDCKELTTVTLDYLNSIMAKNFNSMFENCTSLKTVSMKRLNIKMQDTKQMSRMFYGCTNLTTVDFSEIIMDTTKFMTTTYVFSGCTSLKTIKLKNCSTAVVNKFKDMVSNSGLNVNNITFEV